MENIMEEIKRRLENRESPTDLVRKGFKRSTVYSVAKKIESERKKDNDEQSLERDIYLVRLLKYAFITLVLLDDPNCDPAKKWDSFVEEATECFESDPGTKTPKGFVNAVLNETELTWRLN